MLIIASCLYNFGFAAITQMPIALLMTMVQQEPRDFLYVHCLCRRRHQHQAQVVSRLIAGPGWRTSLFMGILAIVAEILICLFLIKKCPQEIGQTAYEGKPGDGDKRKQLTDKQKAHLAAQAEENSWQGVTKRSRSNPVSFWMRLACSASA